MKPDTFGKYFGKLLKSKREAHFINQSQLSFLSKVSVDSIRSIECGRISSPGLLVAFKLTRALGENLNDWLLLIEKKKIKELERY